MFKRISMILLAAIMVFCCLIPASAATKITLKTSYASLSDVTAQMDLLRTVFSTGKHWSGGKTESQLLDAIKKGDFSDSAMGLKAQGCRWNSTKNPSPSGYLCTSNYFGGGSQCWGFSNLIGYLLFPNHGYPTYEWEWLSGSSVSNVTLEPGDVVRFDGHSAVVWKVVDGTVHFAQVFGNHGTNGRNYEEPVGCYIHWGTWNGGSKYLTNEDIINAVKANPSKNFILKHPASAITGTSSPSTPTEPKPTEPKPTEPKPTEPKPTTPPAPKKPTISASSEKYPTNNSTLPKGESFGLRGVYKTNVGKITSVTATLKTSGGTTKYSFTAYPNANSFDVNGTKGTNGKTLNSTMGFGKLSNGSYTLTVTIKATNSSAETTHTVTRKFSVAQTPKISASSEKYPANNATLSKGKSFGLRGVYTTNVGKITYVTATIKTSGGTTKYSYTAYPNASSFNVYSTKGTNGKTLNNTMGFGSLPRGTYVLTVTIKATNGGLTTTRTITRTFTIK